jgi:hypothetical protein
MQNELRRRVRRDLDEDLRVFREQGAAVPVGMAAGSAAGAGNACNGGGLADEGGAVGGFALARRLDARYAPFLR